MADLKSSAERLLDAVAALEAHLKTERAAAHEATRTNRRQRQRMRGQAQELEAAVATIAEHEKVIEKLTAERDAAVVETGSLDDLRAALREAEGERDALREEAAGVNAPTGVDPETLMATEQARDQAIAAAEDIAAERDEALARIEELEKARSGDAKLREEAAEALDAAIGELKTLSGGDANG